MLEFRYSTPEWYTQGNDTEVRYRTKAHTLDAVLDEFACFLRGVGYSLDGLEVSTNEDYGNDSFQLDGETSRDDGNSMRENSINDNLVQQNSSSTAAAGKGSTDVDIPAELALLKSNTDQEESGRSYQDDPIMSQEDRI